MIEYEVKIVTKEDGASAVRCPVCKSDNIVMDDRDGDSNEVWEECHCEDCESIFDFVFVFKQAEVKTWI